MTNTLLFNLHNAVKEAERKGTSKADLRQDLDVFLHSLVGDGTVPTEQVARLLAHAEEVQAVDPFAGKSPDNPIVSRHYKGVRPNIGEHATVDIDYVCPYCFKPQVLGEAFLIPDPRWKVTGVACPGCNQHVYILMPWAQK